MQILDMKCAGCGYEIAAELCRDGDGDEALLRKALGVLKEDGLYAFFLYLQAKGKNKGPKITQRAFEFLREYVPLGQLPDGDMDHFKAIRENLAAKLDDLLFAKELLERVMVYALYHVRAKGKGGS